jgi:hypothetical protein
MFVIFTENIMNRKIDLLFNIGNGMFCRLTGALAWQLLASIYQVEVVEDQ